MPSWNPLDWFSGGPPPKVHLPPIPNAPTPPHYPPTPEPVLAPPSDPTPPAASNPAQDPTKRLIRQSTLFLAGATFLALSVRLTHRTFLRKRKAAYPKFYWPNNAPPPGTPPNGAMEALEALNLATLNVGAFAMMMVGGGMLATDISSVEELRERVRSNIGEEVEGAEEEFQEWMVGVLASKEVKEKAKRLAEKQAEEEERKR